MSTWICCYHWTVGFPASYYKTCATVLYCNLHGIILIMQVTTKGAGLNPNAKVWQEIPAHQSDIPEWTEDPPWLLTYPPPTVDGKSFVCIHLM